MKYKKGDRVRVRPDAKTMVEFAGKAGIIISIDHSSQATHPYYIQFDDGRRQSFHANELVKEGQWEHQKM